MQSQFNTALVAGPPGSGKSMVCSFMLDGRNSGRYKSSKTTGNAETIDVQIESGPSLGTSTFRKVSVIDTPGLADPKIPVDTIIAKIKSKCGTNATFDAAILVLKSTDYRITIQQVISLKAISKLLENFKPKKIFAVFSHCDISNPSQNEIEGKLSQLKKYTGVDIP